jgi:SAM-dependent methyltransferase
VFPATPAMERIILQRIEALVRLIGRPFSRDDMEEVAGKVVPRLERGWAASPHGLITFSWESRSTPTYDLTYVVALDNESTTDQYARWAVERAEPFGVLPDAMVMHVAAGLPGVRVLDIGAGSGRNAFALANAGHPVDALEPTLGFVALMQAKATELGLPVVAFEGDILSPSIELDPRYGMAILSEVTSHFRKPEDLRLLFERLAGAIEPGGAVVVNVFLAEEGWTPGRLMRELAEVAWSTMYSRAELSAALDGLPFVLETLVPCTTFEAENLPEGAYPPTKWYDSWANGWDVFGVVKGVPPVKLTWLVLRRIA